MHTSSLSVGQLCGSVCPRRAAPASQGAPACASMHKRNVRQARPCVAKAAAGAQSPPNAELFVLKNGVPDYYAILQVDDNAGAETIKSAYRTMAKVCHPDYYGDAGHNLCILLNEAYDILSNPQSRTVYNQQLELALQDQADGYTGKPFSKWVPGIRPQWAKNTDPNESRALFVDEQSCIGCKMCTFCAQATFRMEEQHGRSRVFAQWLNTEEELQTAVDSCPVDCIHWVQKDQLAALEFVCQSQDRVDVSVMNAQQGRHSDVFSDTEYFLKQRKKLEEKKRAAANAMSPMQEAARQEAAQELAKKEGGWWGEMSYRMGQAMASQMTGTRGNVATAASGGFAGARVGSRRRQPQWNASLAKSRGSSVPLERSLVLAKADDR